MRPVLLVFAAACGGKAAVAPPSNTSHQPAGPPHTVLTIDQGPCFGHCPIYTVALDSDGALRWHGERFVLTTGDAGAHLPLETVEEIERAFADARFFELDATGKLPRHDDKIPDMIVCTDTSHTKLTYNDGTHQQTLDDAHCEETPLGRLEERVTSLLGISRYIGGE